MKDSERIFFKGKEKKKKMGGQFKNQKNKQCRPRGNAVLRTNGPTASHVFSFYFIFILVFFWLVFFPVSFFFVSGEGEGAG